MIASGFAVFGWERSYCRLRSILDVIANAIVIARVIGPPIPARAMRVSMVRF
jgi:hypothetical protein